MKIGKKCIHCGAGHAWAS